MSGAHPYLLYYVRGTALYMIEDITVNTIGVLIRDFAEDVPGSLSLYNGLSGNCSLDGDHWAWAARYYWKDEYGGDNTYRPLAYLNYQISTDALHPMFPSDLVGSNLDFKKTDVNFNSPVVISVTPDGTGVVIGYARKTDFNEENDRQIGTYFDGTYVWPNNFDWKDVPPVRISDDYLDSGWTPDNNGDLNYISKNDSDDNINAVAYGEKALPPDVTDLDLNGRTITMTTAQQARVNIIPTEEVFS